MRSYSAIGASLAILLLAAGCEAKPLQGGLPAADRQAIAAIPDQYVKRALEDDCEAVARLYHEEAIQMPPDEPPVKGREGIRQVLAQVLGSEGGVTLEDFSVNILETEGIGELVYVRASYQIESSRTVDGDEVREREKGHYINILRRDEAGRWRIYRQIYNRDHPPGAPADE